jgi:hypothetical protein
MNAKHLWWIIPLTLIIGGILGLKLLSGLLDYTMTHVAIQMGEKLVEYENKTYMVCGYLARCPSDHTASVIGFDCLECRPKNPDFQYTPFNMTEICRGIKQ